MTGPHIGRVGTLAAALGVGFVVFTGWGCAVATADDSASASTASSSASTSAGESAGPQRRVGSPNKSADRDGPDADKSAAGLSADADDASLDARRPGKTSGKDADHTESGPATDDLEGLVADEVADELTVELEDGGAPAPATDEPAAPAVSPSVWTLLGAAPRRADPEDTVAALTRMETAIPLAAEPDDAAEDSIVYTPEPTVFDQVVVFSLRVMRGISDVIGVDIYGLLAKALESDTPPAFLTGGLDVRRTEYEIEDGSTWRVWEFHPPKPSGKTVVAIHGGGFVVQPLFTHWTDYTAMARDTGATVIVPMYPLATTEAGSATIVVPAMAQLVSDQIAEHGAENVSIYADSAGTILAMSAMRHLVLSDRPVPSRMVLLSPAPDASLSNPDIRDVDDPVINVDNLDFYENGGHWAEGYDPKDPMVSPLFIEDEVFAALPPTTIYIGTLEIGLPDTLLFHEKWNAAGGTAALVIGRGQIHDWALGGSINSQASQVRPDIYRQLGITRDPAE